MELSNKHRKTLAQVFVEPTLGTIPWRDIENLMKACGAHITEGRGSRIRVTLLGQTAMFHRPHPRKETIEGAVKSVRELFEKIGVLP